MKLKSFLLIYIIYFTLLISFNKLIKALNNNMIVLKSFIIYLRIGYFGENKTMEFIVDPDEIPCIINY
jgi:hypothetical protein